MVFHHLVVTHAGRTMIKESCETSQLSFRLSVNAEDIHLGPVVNGEGLTHGPLADQLALGFVHDPGQRDLGRVMPQFALPIFRVAKPPFTT